MVKLFKELDHAATRLVESQLFGGYGREVILKSQFYKKEGFFDIQDLHVANVHQSGHTRIKGKKLIYGKCFRMFRQLPRVLQLTI